MHGNHDNTNNYQVVTYVLRVNIESDWGGT